MVTRKQKALETKNKILTTALDLIAKKGFNNVSVDEIVAVSNTSKGAFYTHFKTKHAIFYETFKEVDEYYLKYIEVQSPFNNVCEQLLDFFEAMMTYIQKNIGLDVLRTLYINELNPDRSSFFTNPDRPLYRIINELIISGQESGEFTENLSAEVITMQISRGIRGSLYDWCLYSENYNLIEESKLFLSLLLDGLKIKNSRRSH
ncbi:TetR/AcrR family transcriptional regulator [Alkalihalobacterium elongatum]|uniref:TetR/AcrR family transcriptional regulator n=1 Tax=Alkalihalobacterium elongatum TaxID=2675466 RepID=UPI001C1F2B12|nr:TetR/AcrR family transcriptional regulator [Alkalihalobacterium elongatum]